MGSIAKYIIMFIATWFLSLAREDSKEFVKSKVNQLFALFLGIVFLLGVIVVIFGLILFNLAR